MVGQAQVVVRAEKQHRPPIQQHARALWALDHAKAAAEPALLELGEALAQVKH
jgi:hypothetical protein